MAEDAPIARDAATLAARFDLLVRSTRSDASGNHGPHVPLLAQLHALLHEDLLDLARRGCPHDFVDLHAGLVEAFERLREFSVLPALGGKRIIGFGGAFSAGKSSLINLLARAPLLPVQIDPTTSLPTYVLQGSADEVLALNLRGCPIPLSDDEFLSLNHDEVRLYGSKIASLLRAAYVKRTAFPWGGLAFADTPGYSKPDSPNGNPTDEAIARAQLDAAHAVVWVVPADKGCLSESDLRFLATLRTDVPRLVVVSCADRRLGEIEAIVEGMRRTLAAHNLEVLDVIAVSRSRTAGYPLDALITCLERWNTGAPKLAFPRTFKALFRRYARYLEAELAQAHESVSATNRALAALPSGDAGIAALEPLNERAKADIERLDEIAHAFQQLQRRAFALLDAIGDAVGVDLREPTELDMLGPKRYELVERMRALLKTRRSRNAGRHVSPWAVLDGLPNVCAAAVLLRRNGRRYASRFELLLQAAES